MLAEIICTILEDISPQDLGRTNVHEHLLMRSPLWRWDELDDIERSAGAHLGYDGIARGKYWPDSALLDCLL